ncbi:MAG: hypothetical protein H6819_10240 [Phycisphaerales bacterium]|nr:hypothetical protein [Phycisphaerales bacterium]
MKLTLMLAIGVIGMGMTCEDPAAPMPVPPEAENPVPPEETPMEPSFSVIGIWKRDTGDFGQASLEYGGDVEYLSIEAGGLANLTIRYEDSRALVCIPAAFAHLGDDALLFDFSATDNRAAGLNGSTVALHKMADNNSLELTESDGRTSTFHREAMIAADDLCKHLQETDRFEIDTHIIYGSALAFDGTYLLLADNEDEIRPVDRETGDILPKLNMPQPRYDYIETAQGKDVWLEGRNSSEVILERRSQAGVLIDEIKRSELGLPDFDFACAAFDDVNKRLYMFGQDDETLALQILIVDSEAEPDVLLNTVEFRGYLEAMAFDGTDILAIGNYPQYLYRISIDSFKVTETFHLNDQDGGQFQGVAVVDGAVYLLGKVYQQFGANKTIITRSVLPE